MNNTQEQKRRIRWMAKVAILSAIAAILMFLEFPLPLMPPFLKFDFGDVPALLAAFSMGPLAGVTVGLIKNLINLPTSQTMMVGELANFIIGSSLVATAGFFYRNHKTKKGAIRAMAIGTLVFTVVGCLFNYFVNIPFYLTVMHFPMEAIISLTNKAGNTLVHDLNSLILYVFVPFNLLKGFVVSLIVTLIYKPISPLLHR